jgi:hypothetical protein
MIFPTHAQAGFEPGSYVPESDAARHLVIKIGFLGQQPLVPLLLLGPPFFPIILFGSTTLLPRMTGDSLHMQWPLTSQSHGNVSLREQSGHKNSFRGTTVATKKKLMKR